MAKNNDRNRNDDSEINNTNDVNAGEVVVTVGGGTVGAIVGSALGPLGTVVGGVVGASLGNTMGEAVEDEDDTSHRED